ncbi:hypothetical protein F4859DRAFT_473497 [Xylaria cf. heliscus]|nr:hypothetical protein F4859DRAFT_473497 [Xylaria cf. heliscus]
MSTFTQANKNKHASQESQPSQILPEALQGDGISGSLDPITRTVGMSVTLTEPSRESELSELRPIEANQNIEAKKTPATPISILENPYPTLIDLPPYSHQDRSSTPKVPQEQLTQSLIIRNERIKSSAPTSRPIKRSLSQATTVSGTSTQPSCATENQDVPEEKDLFNPMLMIDETMILERDLSDIVNFRLQEGKPDLLDTLYGEILIKMALNDDELFEAVSRMLKS